MKKLHTDGLLESLDYESFDTCEPCLIGKMTKTLFTGTMERANDLLEIIQYVVRWVLKHAAGIVIFSPSQMIWVGMGISTWWNTSLKHLKCSKELQSEVENHPNKKIKFLWSDRRGEYLSYEFGLHIIQCAIVSQLTPHGTPQRNGVSERHNRNLLDMVRSMMYLTDLPLSFLGYALETDAFTLNRAPQNPFRRRLMNMVW